MPETDDAKGEVPKGTAQPLPEEAMEEEEKVLAGKPDANMPALLTRDVLGG